MVTEKAGNLSRDVSRTTDSGESQNGDGVGPLTRLEIFF